MFRQIQTMQDAVEALQGHLRSALLATNTRDAVGHGGAAQQAAVAVLTRLDVALRGEESAELGAREVDRRLVAAAQRAMTLAVENAERVALGNSIDQMRDRLLDVKTQVDYADAYLRAALGIDGE